MNQEIFDQALEQRSDFRNYGVPDNIELNTRDGALVFEVPDLSTRVARGAAVAGEYIMDSLQGVVHGGTIGAENMNRMIPGASYLQDKAGDFFDWLGVDTSVAPPETMLGGFASGLGQALPGMVPFIGALKQAGYGNMAADVIGGIAGDFVTSGHTDAQAIAGLPKAANMAEDWLGMTDLISPEAADDVSAALEDFITSDNATIEDLNSRLVGALPGAILGPLVDGLGKLAVMAKDAGLERFAQGKSIIPGPMTIEDATPRATATGAGQSLTDMEAQGVTMDAQLEGAWLDQQDGAGVRGSTNVMDDETLSYNFKPVQEWTPEDFEAAGNELGIERLGPLSDPQPLKLSDGREVNIPGGLDGKFTYYDMLTLKAQGIDASQIPESVHAELQKKMSRSLMLDSLTDDQVWAGLAFGMTSPNNPLFPNQLAMSRMRGKEGIDALAESIDWNFGDDVDPKVRKAADKEIAAKFGLNAAAQGGLGVRGTQNYTRVAELAKLFKENPKFFRRRKGENWPEFSERVFSQVAGLKAKTGSFSVVFQDPLEAGVSAIDRHMGQLFKDKILSDPAERLKWQERAINLYNQRNKSKKGKAKAVTMNDLPNGFIGEMILSEVGKTSSPLFRTADGQINKQLSDRMRNTDWIREPKNVEMMGEQYKAALQANQEEALKHGLGIFSSQWMLWDRMRRRLEPHENMFPGLEKMPRMSVDQARLADDAHRETGHKNYSKEVIDKASGEFRLRPTKPMQNPAKLAYFAFPGALMLMQEDEE